MLEQCPLFPRDIRRIRAVSFAKRKLENGMTLVTAISEKAVFAARLEHAKYLLFAFFIILLLYIFLLDLVLKKVIFPIRIISRISSRLARGELGLEIPYKSKNELGDLAENIHMMTSQMKEYIDYISEQTDRERREKEAAVKESQSKSEFLASMYLSLHEVDLNEDVFSEIASRRDIAQNIGAPFGNARVTIRRVMEDRVANDGQSRQDFMEFINFDTLNERMKDKITIAQEFYGVSGYWCRARFIVMDGIQTLHAMQAMEDNMSAGKPCVALTANALTGVKKMYLEEGFTDYLSKPVNPEKLEDMIRQYLPPEYLEELDEDDEVSENAADESEFIAKFKAIEGVEFDAALQNCGTVELLESTVKKYYDSIDEKSRELDGYFAEEDWDNYCTKVHALKSTSRLIGAMEVSKMAAELEELSDKKLADEVRARHAPLMERFRSFKEKFAPLVTQGAAEQDAKPPITEDALKEKLVAIGNAADAFDIDALDAIMAELSAVALPASWTEKFAKIRTCVENVDFIELKKLLEA